MKINRKVPLLFLFGIIVSSAIVFFVVNYFHHHHEESSFSKLCKTMLKSQTVDIVIPTNDKEDERNNMGTKESQVITFIIDGNLNKDDKENKDVSEEGFIYYYEGKPDLENNNLQVLKYDKEGGYVIHEMLEERNQELLVDYKKLKKEWERGNLTDSAFKEEAKQLRIKQAANPDAKRPIVSIKPTANASYADVIRMLDEMQINQISTWQIERLNKQDSMLFEQKVGRPISGK